MDKPMIEVNGIKKRYRIGQIGGGTLKAELESWWARVRKKEDPNTSLFDTQRIVGDTFMALNGVNFTVNKGEAVAIIGGNGAGKSTLLKILSRVTAPTEGDAVLRGRVASMLEVGTGFNPEMTGRENIYMNGAILGMTKAEIDSKIEEIIDFSECRDFIDTPVKRYSSGMYVKLAFAVAAHLDSEIMIMDEVLAVGDVKFQRKCLTKMSDESTEHGKTVLYVSHNMATVRRLCTRAIVLKDGKVIYDGDVERGIEVYSEESSELAVKKTFAQPDEYTNVQKASVLASELVGKQNNNYNAGDDLKFTIYWKNLKNLSSVKFRCIIQEGASVTGTCLSPDIEVDPTKENQQHTLTIKTGEIPDGRYKIYLSIGYYEGTTTLEDYANQEAAVEFVIEENARQCGMKWVRGVLGQIVFENSIVE